MSAAEEGAVLVPVAVGARGDLAERPLVDRHGGALADVARDRGEQAAGGKGVDQLEGHPRRVRGPQAAGARHPLALAGEVVGAIAHGERRVVRIAGCRVVTRGLARGEGALDEVDDLRAPLAGEHAADQQAAVRQDAGAQGPRRKALERDRRHPVDRLDRVEVGLGERAGLIGVELREGVVAEADDAPLAGRIGVEAVGLGELGDLLERVRVLRLALLGLRTEKLHRSERSRGRGADPTLERSVRGRRGTSRRLGRDADDGRAVGHVGEHDGVGADLRLGADA